MSVEIREIQYENFGKCVQISNGVVDVAVTIDCGPRIIRFGYCNEANVFYHDLERKYGSSDEKISACFGKDAAFRCYGGHRLWLSPEKMPDTYYPDNEPVVYGILPDGVNFTPARQKHNDMQLSFEVMLGSDAKDMMVVHSVKNCSKERQACALWAITMMDGGGVELIPQNAEKGAGLLPNRLLAAWPYTDLHDSRISMTNRFITVRHDPQRSDPLKLGTNDLPGWAAYYNKGYLLTKRFVHTPQAAYPDFGCSYETYISKDYVEMESLSPLYMIEPGEGVRHVENFSLSKTEHGFPENEEEIEAYLAGLE